MADKMVLEDPIVTLNAVDISDEVQRIEIPVEAEVLRATTFTGAGWRQIEIGEASSDVSMRIVVHENMGASSVHKILRDNFKGKLALTAKPKDAAVSEDNVEAQCNVGIRQVPFGGEVNQLFQGDLSLPVDGEVTWAVA